MTPPSPTGPDIEPARPSFWRNLSFVWLVPVLALAASLALAWQTYAQRGVAIEITFTNALGITAGETTLRFRDVTIGQVENVTFTADLSRVLVRARVDKDIAPFLDDSAEFWVVSPKVSARGITGLSTVLSGVYIEGAWDQERGVQQFRFEGLDNPPLVQPGRAGKRITLISKDGSLLSDGAPVFFHGIEVGRIEKPRLTVSTDMIVADAFIEAPHDRRLNLGTRFWDKSGFTVSLSGAGLSVDFDSLSSLLAGGLEFDSIYEGAEPVGPGHVFTVYPDEAEARKSLFLRSNAEAVEIAAEFGESVAGLEPGADVRFGGLLVGQVVAIAAQILETEFGPEIRPLARLSIEPARLGMTRGADRDAVLDFFDVAVANGLRARLATTSLFSSALIVELVEVADAAPAVFQRDAKPVPIIPSQPSNLPDFTATAEGVFDRINKLKIEELIQQAISTMASIETFAGRESLQSLPDDASALLKDTRALINDEATRALPGDVRDAVAELRAVVTELRERGAVDNLVAALEKADRLVANLSTASEDFPGLVEELRSVAQKAARLEAEELIAAATEVLDSARTVIGSEAAQALPETLDAALDEVRSGVAELRAMAADLRQRGAIDNLVSALEEADTLIANMSTASEDFPALVEEVRVVARKAAELEAKELVAAATDVLQSAQKVIGTEAAQALPETLDAALDEVRAGVSELRAMVAELNEGDAVAKLVSALEDADTAAANFALASDNFPILVEELRGVVQKVNDLKTDELVDAATRVLDSAEAVIGTETARALPGSLTAALDEVRGALAELREGGVVENANATFASAREASEAVAEAAAGLPDLSAKLDRLVTQAETLMATYGTRSDFNDETLAALREVRNAARAVSQLARTLERDPGLLIRGR